MDGWLALLPVVITTAIFVGTLSLVGEKRRARAGTRTP
jgi:hypothetical protein